MEYINEKNQEILWNSINKIKCFNLIMDENYKKDLFKNVIKNFYQDNMKRQLNQTELIEINKKTILYVIQLLTKDYSNDNKNSTVIQGLNIDLKEEDLTIDFENNCKNQSKQTSYSQEYLNRQKDYEIMMKKDVPKNDILFDNKIEDKAIENMEELLQQQIKQRELEIQIINEEIKSKMEKINEKENEINSDNLKKKVSFQTQNIERDNIIQ